MPAHNVVRVLPMWNCLMAATRTVLMCLLVAAAIMRRRASIRVTGADGDSVLVDVITVGVVHMTIVQVIGMPIMIDCGVPAAGSMLMRMGVVSITGLGCHVHLSGG
jgi:hypothetical protein